MDKETIIRLAREAGLHLYVNELTEEPYALTVERFARLVARHVRNARREADRLNRIEKRKRYAENKAARGE